MMGLCGVMLAMLFGGCGMGARDAAAEAKPSTALYSEGAAAAVADALLAAVPLPADTENVSAPPPAVAGELGRSANSEDSAKAVQPLRLLVLHRPPGSDPLVPGQARADPEGRNSWFWRDRDQDRWLVENLDAPLASPLAGPR